MAAQQRSDAGLRPVTPTTILARRLQRLTDRLDDADGLDTDLVAEMRELAALAGGLDDYLDACTTPASDALAELAEQTRTADWTRASEESDGPRLEAEMLSGHVEGRFLQFLVHMTRAQRVLEVGMFTGYSALAMAEALPDDGVLVACEIEPGVAGFAQSYFDESPSGGKVEVIVGPALDTLHDLSESGSAFDLVFIDADKGGYGDYLDTVLDTGLLAPHGIVCVDNTLMQGQPYLLGEPTENGAAIARFNEKVADDPRLEQVLVPLRDGVTLIRRADT